MKFVWETPEEIDKALAQRLSRIPQAPQSFTAGAERKEQRKLWQHQAL